MILIQNINELRNRKGTDGSAVQVLSTSALGDGGASEYYWDSTSTETDNGSTIFAVNGVVTGRWKSILQKASKTYSDTLFGGGGGGGPLPYTLVTDLTTAGIQTAVNNAASGTVLVLMGGTATLTGSIDIQNKTNLKIMSFGNTTLARSNGAEHIVVRGNVSNITLEGLNFSNTYTSTGYGIILINEQGPVTGFTINNCFFTNSTSPNNAITTSSFSESSNVAVQHRDIRITNCRFKNIGRMGIEIVNHVWNNTGVTQIYTDGLVISNNYFENLGVTDANGYGMACSISGLHENVTFTGNVAKEAKGLGFEFVGVRNTAITGNSIKSSTNTVNGFSITDNNHGVTTNITVSGNSTDVKGRAILVYDCTWVTMTGNNFKSTLRNDIRSNSCQISGNGWKVTNDFGVLYMEHALYCTIIGNTMSSIGSTNAYGVINLAGGSANNIVDNNILIRPTAAQQVVIEGTAGNTIGTNVEIKL